MRPNVYSSTHTFIYKKKYIYIICLLLIDSSNPQNRSERVKFVADTDESTSITCKYIDCYIQGVTKK